MLSQTQPGRTQISNQSAGGKPIEDNGMESVSKEDSPYLKVNMYLLQGLDDFLA